MNIQLKLLKEMNISMDSHKQDKDLLVGTHLFQSTNLISEYINVLEKNINIMENKMKDMLKQ
jgi:hypothetical protein